MKSDLLPAAGLRPGSVSKNERGAARLTNGVGLREPHNGPSGPLERRPEPVSVV